jgi:hypothetical protein
MRPVTGMNHQDPVLETEIDRIPERENMASMATAKGANVSPNSFLGPDFLVSLPFEVLYAQLLESGLGSWKKKTASLISRGPSAGPGPTGRQRQQRRSSLTSMNENFVNVRWRVVHPIMLSESLARRNT